MDGSAHFVYNSNIRDRLRFFAGARVRKHALSHPEIHLLLCHFFPLTPGREWGEADLSAPYWRLYWNPDSGGRLELASGTVPLGPKCLVLIPPDTSYRGRLDRPVRHLYLHFLFDLDYQGPPDTVWPLPVSPGVRLLCRQLCCGAAEGNSPKHLLAGYALVYLAMAQLPADALGDRFSDDRIAEAVVWMHRQVHRKVGNEELARRAHMSTNGFVRLFRRTTGRTPQEYHLRLRLNRAGVLLHHTRRTIEEIAQATGFCDRYHFTRAFCRLRGLGPATFRKLLP